MSLHLSEERISRRVAGERFAEDERHLGECAECAHEVRRTEAALELFRETVYRSGEYGQAPGGRASGIGFRRLGAAALTFAAVVAALAIAFVLQRKPAEAPPAHRVFVRIPYVVPPAPYERTRIVRMEVPVAALIAAGLRVHLAGAAELVRADVLVAQDGRPLAVSLVSKGQEE